MIKMTIKLTGKFAIIVDKILGDRQDDLGIFCWKPSDEKFLLDAEMDYYNRTGISPYETSNCPEGFDDYAINFRKRLK